MCDNRKVLLIKLDGEISIINQRNVQDINFYNEKINLDAFIFDFKGKEGVYPNGPYSMILLFNKNNNKINKHGTTFLKHLRKSYKLEIREQVYGECIISIDNIDITKGIFQMLRTYVSKDKQIYYQKIHEYNSKLMNDMFENGSNFVKNTKKMDVIRSLMNRLLEEFLN